MTVVHKHRSPAYPAIPLKDAIERARTFFKHEGKHEAALSTAATHWGYTQTSSSRLTTVAALKSFGLMADKGDGSARKVYLTQLGLAIVQDERLVSPEREASIRQAAMQPKIISELWGKYGADLPSHDTLAHYLKVDRGYNPNAVNDVIRVYKETVSFAGLGVNSEPTDQSEGSGDDAGQDMDAESSQRVLKEDAAGETQGKRQRLVIDAGEEVANIRVARDCTIRLVASGPYTRKSIEALVAQLELGLKLGSYDELSDADEKEN